MLYAWRTANRADRHVRLHSATVAAGGHPRLLPRLGGECAQDNTGRGDSVLHVRRAEKPAGAADEDIARLLWCARSTAAAG